MKQLLKTREIHLFKKFGHDLVYDVNRMHLFQVNSMTRDILENAEGKTPQQVVTALSHRYPPEDVAEILEQLIELNLVGYHISPPEPQSTVPGNGGDFIRKVVLYVTQDCNLHCRYCLTRRGGNISKQHMSEDVARASVDLLFHECGDSPKLNLGFYGGEPLMQFNLIKTIVPYADRKARQSGKDVKYTITTNGTLLTDPVVDFLTRHNFQVLLSIDGPGDVHDRNRTFPDGTGSFDKVYAGFKKLKRENGRIGTLSVVNRLDLSLKEISQSLTDLGFPPPQLAPAVSPEGDIEIDGSGAREFHRQFHEMVQSCIDDQRLFSENPPVDFSKVFKRLEEKSPLETNCSAGFNRVSVDPEGNILPCDNFIGIPTFYMGNVLTGFEKKHAETFKKIRASHSPVCQTCWARQVCGGWCPSFSYNRFGSLEKPVDDLCQSSKEYFEVAMGVYSIYKSRDNP